MGTCVSSRDPSELSILEKEEILKMNQFKIDQIKASFFDLYYKDIITYEKVIKGMKILHKNNQEFEDFFDEETETFQVFNSILKAICVNKEENDLTKNAFKFKNLMYFLFLLSNNFPNEKIQEIFRLEGKSKLKKEDVEKILKELFLTVIDCSLQLFIQEMKEDLANIQGKKFKIFKTKIEPIVEESAKEIYSIGAPDKNPIELGVLFYQLLVKQQYSAASTEGKIIKLQIVKEKLAAQLESMTNQQEEQQQEEKKDEQENQKQIEPQNDNPSLDKQQQKELVINQAK